MDEELLEFYNRMDDTLKQGREFNDAVMRANKNGDYSQLMALTDEINCNIISQYNYIRTLVNYYHNKGDRIKLILLMQTLKHLENIERLNIMAREAAKEYIKE
jgi:hypothetical protein